MDLDRVFERGHFPAIAVLEPAIGHFYLLAVDDALTEQAVLVANAAAHRGQIERRERVHEARGEAAKATIAGSGFGLFV